MQTKVGVARAKPHSRGLLCPMPPKTQARAPAVHKFFMEISWAPAMPGGLLTEQIVTKEEIIAAINECAARLGHPPSSTELRKSANVNKYDIRKFFGTHVKALDACGMEAL